MGIYDEVSGAAKEVGEEITEEVCRGFISWEGVEAHAVHLEFHCFGTHAQLESIKLIVMRLVILVKIKRG